MKLDEKIKYFFTHGIWTKQEHEYRSSKVRWGVRQLKILIYMVRGFGEHDIMIRSAALTFYTLMSVVPIAALIFGIMKGFGMETNLNAYLYSEFPQYTPMIDQVLDFANNLLIRTKGGVIASVGFVVLLWAVMRVFGNIESAFNHIWEVRRERSIARKFSDYMAVVFVAPILWLISNSMSLALRSRLSLYASSIFIDILYALASVVVIWLMFAFVYRVMPNTKVKMRSAVMAGIIAGTAFQIFQVVYVWVQTSVTSYNAIYGSFAALPLFLIWAQTSWQILLTGAELSFAYQNINRYEQERQASRMSYDQRRKVLVAVMMVTIRHFMAKSGAVSSEEVAAELGLPVRIVRDVIFDLEKAGLLSAVQNDHDEKVNTYIPARDVHTITLWDVVNSVEESGLTHVDLTECSDLDKVRRLMERVKLEVKESPQNVLLMELSDEKCDTDR